jgi:hypothetical protein
VGITTVIFGIVVINLKIAKKGKLIRLFLVLFSDLNLPDLDFTDFGVRKKTGFARVLTGICPEKVFLNVNLTGGLNLFCIIKYTYNSMIHAYWLI